MIALTQEKEMLKEVSRQATEGAAEAAGTQVVTVTTNNNKITNSSANTTNSLRNCRKLPDNTKERNYDNYLQNHTDDR